MRNENIYQSIMSSVYVVADNIYSPIGNTTAQNFESVKQGISGIKLHQDTVLSVDPVYLSLFNLKENENYKQLSISKFDRLLKVSLQDALGRCDIDPNDDKTILIVSTTKGNIRLLEQQPGGVDLQEQISLHKSARLLAHHFGFVNKPLVVSNACISGIMAILTGYRLLQSGQYKNAVIVGADEISKFVLSGFQSFQAISSEPCKPFDENRTGITLGEGVATMILSSNPKYASNVKVLGGAVSNDANHISAPSRTGEELCGAIKRTLNTSGLTSDDIDLISAHGTATIALAGLDSVPANSLKGYYGHTLGAAGLIESIISIQSLKQNLILPTAGFHKMGVSSPINICTTLTPKRLKTCLKTASGFGGCNAAVAFSK
jgi:3-oxoacyl-[acyl-carrier-protein] synthase-1